MTGTPASTKVLMGCSSSEGTAPRTTLEVRAAFHRNSRFSHLAQKCRVVGGVGGVSYPCESWNAQRAADVGRGKLAGVDGYAKSDARCQFAPGVDHSPRLSVRFSLIGHRQEVDACQAVTVCLKAGVDHFLRICSRRRYTGDDSFGDKVLMIVPHQLFRLPKLRHEVRPLHPILLRNGSR